MILILLLPELLGQTVQNHRGPDGGSHVTPHVAFNSECRLSQKGPARETLAHGGINKTYAA